MEIKKIIIEELENEGCNNDNYPRYTVVFDNGEEAHGRTCRCRRGCSGTDCLDGLEVGNTFASVEDFNEYVEV